MLGGGQPAHIPELDARWRLRMHEMMAHGDDMEKVLGNYDPPRGNAAFLEALADMLRRELGWQVTADNCAVTAGGQTAFFFLFHLLAGEMADGRRKKILLPLVPEYIGYANQSVRGDLFQAHLPIIEHTGPNEFKYRIDFDTLVVGDDIAAICVSRPTNPTGNVLTDDEIFRLFQMFHVLLVLLVLVKYKRYCLQEQVFLQLQEQGYSLVQTDHDLLRRY
jgi:valine--pyruvate aminotransferase